MDVASSVDAMLLGRPPKVEVRSMAEDGTVTREAWQPQSESQQQQATAPSPPQPMEQQRVYTYAVSSPRTVRVDNRQRAVLGGFGAHDAEADMLDDSYEQILGGVSASRADAPGIDCI